MATARLALRRRANSDGTKTVIIALSHKSKNNEFGPPETIKVPPAFFDKGAKDRIKKGCPTVDNTRRANKYINGELSKAVKYLKELEDADRLEAMTIIDVTAYIKKRFKEKDDNPALPPKREETRDIKGGNLDFINYLEKHLEKIPKKGTRSAYNHALVTLKKFVGKKKETLLFKEVTKAWLSNFKLWMTPRLAPDTIVKILSRIKATFNYAIDIDEIVSIELYPFRKFKMPKGIPRNLRLPVATIRAIRDIKLDNWYDAMARDFFMLSFYLIGMNNCDIFDLVDITDEGRIEYTRNKTQKLYSIKVEPEAWGIFKRRKGKYKPLLYQENYKTPHSLQSSINKILKRIGAQVGVPDLKMYHARHSWAGIAAKKPIGAGKPLIAQALGHGATTVTDAYFDYDNELVDDLNRKVLDLLNQKE